MMSSEGLGWQKGRKKVEKMEMEKVGRSGGSSKMKKSQSMRMNKDLKEGRKRKIMRKQEQGRFKSSQTIQSISRTNKNN
jgi:hypothetical protein